MPTPSMSAPSMPDPLAQLRDIHLPANVSAWPLAPGWWLLLALLVILVALGVCLLRRRQQRSQPLPDFRSWAAKQLQLSYETWQQHQDKRQFLQDAQSLLRRLALQLAGTDSTRLSGEAWCQWLHQQSQLQGFTNGVGQVLATGPYQPQPDYDVTALYELVEQWILHADIPTQTPVSAIGSGEAAIHAQP